MRAPTRNTNLLTGEQEIPARGSQSPKWLRTRARLGIFDELGVTIPFNVSHFAGSSRSPGRKAACEHFAGSYRLGKKLAMLSCAEYTWPRYCQRIPRSNVRLCLTFQVSWTYSAPSLQRSATG